MKIWKNKQEVREYVWNLLEKKKVALFPNRGHIPNFKGVEKTIEKIKNIELWKKAKIIFISPDTPQRYLIKHALNEKKLVIMATPRLRKGFAIVNSYGNSLREILQNSKIVGYDIPKPDLIIIGSVAVDKKGNRIGKGGGFGDREIEIINSKFGKVKVITNVHDLQVFDDFSYFMEKHDHKVDIIVTPTRIIECN